MAANRSKYFLFTVMLVFFFASVAEIFASTHTAASCSETDVRGAVNAASEGDTVIVPAGSCTWSSPIIITRGISLKGAGIGNTNIIGNITDSNNGVVSYKPDGDARMANNPMRITGFTINCASKSNGIYIYNNSSTPITKVRIDHNRIINAGGSSAGRNVYIIGSVYGVADNNTIEISGGHGMDSEGSSSGIPQWNNLSRAYGSANNFYFEDNTLTCSGSNVFHAGGHGGRYVARYNDYKNNSSSNIYPVFDMHGNQPSDITAMMITEVYGNNVDLGLKGGRIIDQRGGMVISFYNSVKWGSDGANIHIREEYLDSSYPPGNTFLMHPTNSYYWNNRSNGALITSVELSSNGYENTYDLAQNVDFWMQNSTYNGTTQKGIYCGTSLPANCTVGDGAWITNQSCSNTTNMVGVNPATPISGTFYKCTSTNAWTSYFTPYTYPHPLRGAVGSDEIRSPSGLIVVPPK